MRESIRELRAKNKEIRALLTEADERINRVILAHYLTHEKDLASEFALFQEIRAHLLWLFATEEKGLIVRYMQEEVLTDRDMELPLQLQEQLSGLFDRLKDASDQYTPPADGCGTYDTMTENLATLHALFDERRPVAEALYKNIAGGMQ